jgi:hypothetical protein
MNIDPALLHELAGYMRRVVPIDHDEADRIFQLVTLFEAQPILTHAYQVSAHAQ